MHRNHLLQLLTDYTPSDQDEIDYKDDIIEFVQDNEECFERSLEHGHITASTWLLNKEGDKALLTHHKKLNRWFQLGGHCDSDSDILASAIREAQEESGIENIKPVHNQIFDVDVHFITGNAKEEKHYHYDVRFLLQVQSDEKVKISSESKDLRWVSKNLDELPTDEVSVTRMFKKWVLIH